MLSMLMCVGGGGGGREDTTEAIWLLNSPLGTGDNGGEGCGVCFRQGVFLVAG